MTGLMNATFTRGSTVRYEDTSSSEVDVAIVVSGALHYLDIFPALASVSARLGGESTTMQTAGRRQSRGDSAA